MTKYVLIGCFGNDDVDVNSLNESQEEVLACIDFLLGKKSLKFGINSVIKQLAKLKIYPSEAGLDLLVLAVMVQAADTKLNRVQTSQDAWTREIRLVVPVSDTKIWLDSKTVIEKMLGFLTGDFWTINFRKRPIGFENLIPRKALIPPPDYRTVSLFSGGLDSLVGAIDALESGDIPIFISHAGEGAVSKPQSKVFDKLSSHYASKKIERLRFPSARIPRNLFSEIRAENSTRGRSFLFFALAAFTGSGLKGTFSLQVPENGLIALNVPLDSTRLGSLSTRTTHPYYIHRWNELLRHIQIQGNLLNPYWNKTKGEMVAECKNQDFLKSITHFSVSCAHPSAGRYKGGSMCHHCGHCVPCIIRRSAINRAWGSDNDNTEYSLGNEIYERVLDSTKAEGIQIRSYQYAIDNLKKKPNSAHALIHKPGPLLEDVDILHELADIYKRGMDEVGLLLEGVKTAPTSK